MKKMAPKKVKLCPGCPTNDLSLDITPKFNFVADNNRDTKKSTIITNIRDKIKGKISSLF